MATRNIVPRGNGEASLGTSAKHWGGLWVDEINEGADLGNNASLKYRQPSTAYALGAVAYHADLPGGMYLEAIAGGTSTTTDITISTTTEGTTVTDGTVTWAIRKINAKSLTNLRQPSTVYVAGDIAYSPLLASWQRLEAVTGGTTASTDLPVGASTDTGLYITDGTVTWIICDVRDGDMVGDISFHPVLLPGHILANGASVDAADYPRLLAWAQANSMTTSDATDISKYVYDSGLGTLKVPNVADRVIQAGTAVGKKEAGVPNITGSTGHLMIVVTGVNTGAFYSSNPGRANMSGSTEVATDVIGFDASRVSPVYGNSTTVQPKAILQIAQIKY